MKRVVTGLTMLAALYAVPLDAQGIGLGVGTLVPQGDVADGQKTGFSGILSFEIGRSLAFRAEALWANSSLDGAIVKSSGGVPVPESANVSGSVSVIGGLGSVVLHLGAGPIKPYLLGGAGYYNRSVKQDATGAATEFQHLSTKDSDIGYHFGVGLKFTIIGISAFGEARYHTVKIDDQENNFIPLIVGLRIGG